MTGTRVIKWIAVLHDTGDGTGDALLELTNDMMSQLRWKVGDDLTVKKFGDDTLILRKIDSARS